MASVVTIRGYSDFFTSGFRAVTNRTSGDSSSPCSTSRASPLSDITQRRRSRPLSMIIQKTVPKNTEKKHSRRSSIVSFSSKLFDRKGWHSVDENSVSKSEKSSRFSSKSNELPDVWITAGGPCTTSTPDGSLSHRATLRNRTIDPFSSSPESKSLFIDFSSTDSLPYAAPKRESFLSMTGSSSPRSSVILPQRRERPTSVQTMPLPSRSRCSSTSYPSRVYGQEKTDFFWIVEEEPELGNEPLVETQADEWDAPAKIDWREFHIDLIMED
ncbi:hypothetical protein CVT24_011052 [Panaeolus cyanescens]|uniref:Uncharacterized protein n=1 Tax=Panaeolus cyanescens TaxID=181874 RepID=A0A409VG09_9AGAR|nr:hypothetical protein CVT24_011052 [Panaeolus cyanescens]